MRSIPILMYHEVAVAARPDFVRFTVTVRQFAWQMRWLARMGFSPISMDQLVGARQDPWVLPRRPVAITFDDGFAECGRTAPPILMEHGFTATFYLVAGLLGKPSEWLERELGFRLPLMKVEAIRALQRDGMHFGSHTVTHPRLAQISPAEIHDELVRSRGILEQALACRIEHLAYPFGSHDETVLKLARDAGYVTACTTIEARSRGEDLLALRRIPVYGTDSRLDFVSRLFTARPVAPLVRDGIRTLRSRFRAGRS